MKKLLCDYCGVEFKRCLSPSRISKTGVYYCSSKCWHEIRRAGCVCESCGKKFKITLSRFEKGHGRFCSKKCVGKGNVGKNNVNWKGGRQEATRGYIYLLRPNHPHARKSGYVAEHRLVMEKKLDRYLKPGEVVHHLNGDKKNNCIENLRLHKNQSHHKRQEEKLLQWVKKNYGTLDKLKEALNRA